MANVNKSVGGGNVSCSTSQTGKYATINGGFCASPFESGTTLGRSGHIFCPGDRLAERIEHLDALLCVITADSGGDEPEGFANCGDEIQKTVLALASSLATEIHELHKQIMQEKMNREHARG